MITPEESKHAREYLKMSQRSVAEEAGVPRTYLNQFERRRWIATDAFLLKLSEFYFENGVFDLLEIEHSSIEQPHMIVGANIDNSGSELGEGSPDDDTDSDTSESDAESGWSAVSRAAIAIAIVGGILAATGNLPIVLGLLKHLGSTRQPQSPFGL